MRLIPAGEFSMGSTIEQTEAAKRMDKAGQQFPLSHETPQFAATIGNFYLSVFAVTNEQFARFLLETKPSPEQLQQWVSWLDRITIGPNRLISCASTGFQESSERSTSPGLARKLIAAGPGCGCRLKLNGRRLRAGTMAAFFPWGNEWDPDRLCWWGSHDEKEIDRAGGRVSKGCSPYGIFQMAGNVEEWCADWYQPDVYKRYATGNLAPPRAGMGRVIRGGNCLRKNKLEFRCAMRRANTPSFTNILLTGIRCAADAQEI